MLVLKIKMCARGFSVFVHMRCVLLTDITSIYDENLERFLRNTRV